MNFINSWLPGSKQDDKFNITFRIGKFTLLEIKYDHSKKSLRLMGFNLGGEHIFGAKPEKVIGEVISEVKKAVKSVKNKRKTNKKKNKK